MSERTIDEVDKDLFHPKENYVQAHIQGNSLFPQRAYIIGIFVTSAITLDPPDDFQKLRKSHLSESQLIDVADAMDQAHKANGIMKFTPGYPNRIDGSQNVPLERLAELWRWDVYMAMNMLLQKINNGPPLPSHVPLNDRGQDKKPIQVQNWEDANILNEYFHNPRNRVALSLLQDSAYVIESYLQTSIVDDISKIWLSVIDHERKNIAYRDFYDNDYAYGLIKERYGQKRRGKVITPSISSLLTKMHPKNIGLQDDVILELIKLGILKALELQQHAMPFGIEIEKPKTPETR